MTKNIGPRITSEVQKTGFWVSKTHYQAKKWDRGQQAAYYV